MREPSATHAAEGVPIDHLRVAGALFVARAVEALDLAVHLALGDAEDEAADGDHADEHAAAEQADRRRLGRVAQRAQGDEGPDDEVAVGHADLQAALPRLQAIAVEGQVLDVLLAEAAVRQRGVALVTGEGLRAPPLGLDARIDEVDEHREVCGLRAGPHLLSLLLVILLNGHQIKDLPLSRQGLLHVPVIPPAHLRGFALAVNLRVALQRVEGRVLWRVIPLILGQSGEQKVQLLLLHDGRRQTLEVGNDVARLRLLGHSDVLGLPRHAAAGPPAEAPRGGGEATEGHAEADKARGTQGLGSCGRRGPRLSGSRLPRGHRGRLAGAGHEGARVLSQVHVRHAHRRQSGNGGDGLESGHGSDLGACPRGHTTPSLK
mmetsp:Transcript_2877/g.6897  ORF Transcript_2877/g.6897 Transcript_2877/m.6897 type:complete len:376 (-) Transcript_2877:18-1145(-)